MKFGKSIRAEARNNRALSFVNFKFLKRLLKRCTSAASTGAWVVAQEEDTRFRDVLEAELKKVGESVHRELEQISSLQAVIQERLPLLDLSPDPETFDGMTFEELQSHLQSLGGLTEIPSEGSVALPTSVKTSAALCDFCVALGKVSSRCKRLRRCVLWNAVAIVKILKKRQKCTTEETLEHLPTLNQTATEILSSQDWYTCPSLSQIVSMVETTTDELMQHLTNRPPNRERYQCPICLDVVVDPVCLKTCGHRFCWACLCMAYCERPDGTLERCPCCRAAFPLDPEAFEIDGILSRFLRNFFPDQQSQRVAEQKEFLRQRLAGLSNQPAPPNHYHHHQYHQTPDSQINGGKVVDPSGSVRETEVGSSVGTTSSAHCCPDCVSRSPKIQPLPFQLTTSLQESLPSSGHHPPSSSAAAVVCEELSLLPVGLLSFTELNEAISTNMITPSPTHKIHLPPSPLAPCRHSANVRGGRPAGVDALGYSAHQQQQKQKRSPINAFPCDWLSDDHHLSRLVEPSPSPVTSSTRCAPTSLPTLAPSTLAFSESRSGEEGEEKHHPLENPSSLAAAATTTTFRGVSDFGSLPSANNGIVRMMLLHLDEQCNTLSAPASPCHHKEIYGSHSSGIDGDSPCVWQPFRYSSRTNEDFISEDTSSPSLSSSSHCARAVNGGVLWPATTSEVLVHHLSLPTVASPTDSSVLLPDIASLLNNATAAVGGRRGRHSLWSPIFSSSRLLKIGSDAGSLNFSTDFEIMKQTKHRLFPSSGSSGLAAVDHCLPVVVMGGDFDDDRGCHHVYESVDADDDAFEEVEYRSSSQLRHQLGSL